MPFRNVAIFSAVSATLLATASALAPASVPVPAPAPQISIGIGLGGGPPVCPYGYYDYAPYNCAAYGYYGPDWFNSGVFVGAGPWFHGDRGFYGHVDNRYDPRHGYNGPYPDRGAQPFNHFQGNEARDGFGHTGNAGHSPSGEHYGGAQGFHGAPQAAHGAPQGSHGGGGHR